MNKILILTPDAKQYVGLIEERNLLGLSIVACDVAEEAIELVEDCNILLGIPGLVAEVLPHAKRLEWVQSTFAGINLLCASGLRTDYLLTGVKGIFGPLMSEYVFAYILALERSLFETRDLQKAATWKELPYRSLQKVTLGICGLGSIGNHVAQSGKHFGMRVLGFKNTPGHNSNVEQVYTRDSFGDFLGQLDYLVMTLPSTHETKHMINYEVLQQMKPESVIINVGRGIVIDEDDLISALQEGVIRAAVLDVFEEEPLSAENPLWEMPNVFVTPHNSAVSFPEDIVRIFARNYERFIKQEPLEYVIDFKKGY